MIGERFGPTWFGEKGTLASVADKIQCHICGNAFHNLATHVIRRHGISVDNYRDEFGLMRKTGLISRVMARKKWKSARFSNPEFLAAAMDKNPYLYSSHKTRSKRSLQETLIISDRISLTKKLLKPRVPRQRVSRMVPKETVCVWCHVIFIQPSGKQKRTCSNKCRVSRQRQLHAAMMTRLDVLEKLSCHGKRRASSAVRTSQGAFAKFSY